VAVAVAAADLADSAEEEVAAGDKNKDLN